MALTNKLTAIANAIRAKNGTTGKLSLDGMAAAISALKTTFSTQAKSVTLSESAQTIKPDANHDGLSQVSVPGISNTYVGSAVTKQAGKTVTPTKTEQTAVDANVYTTGAVKVGAIPSNYIIPSGSQNITQNDTYDVTSLASVVVNVSGGGGLPSGFTAIARGTHTLSSAVTGSSTFTVTHNLGVVPDMFLFYASSNIASTYSMLYAFRSAKFGYRGSTYLNLCGYHGNNTSNITATNVTTSYGIKSLTATQATITSYSTSTSYGWRAGTYEWIAIKFS